MVIFVFDLAVRRDRGSEWKPGTAACLQGECHTLRSKLVRSLELGCALIFGAPRNC